MTLSTRTTCVLIERTDGEKIGITQLDQDITVDGRVYRSAASYTPSTVVQNSELAVNNADIEGVLSAVGVQRDEIVAGLFDHARVYMFYANYTESAPGKITGTVDRKLGAFRWGEARLFRGRYIAEIRSLEDALNQTIGEKTSPKCRADLGDSRCKVGIAGLTVSSTVTSVTDRATFSDSARGEAAGYFDYGLLTFTSGNNAGFSMEVKTFDGSAFELQEPLPYDIQAGDGFDVYPGCDKTLATCRDKFSNVANMRAEPFIPGEKELAKFGGQ